MSYGGLKQGWDEKISHLKSHNMLC